MKLFQKTALAVAIAAVPFLSVNALEALDDATLSNMTGQAGVTIESQLDGQGISIDEIQYTDTNSGAPGEVGGGSVNIQNINIASASGNFSTEQVIDIDASGNLVTSSTTTGTGKVLSLDSVQLRSATQAASVTAGTYNAGTAGANLVSNLSMTTKSTGTSYATILNLSDRAATGNKVAANTAITYTPADTSDPDPLNHTAESYTYLAGPTAATDTVDITKAINHSTDPKLAIVSNGSSQITNLNVELLDGAIAITGMRVHGGFNGTVDRDDLQSKQVIWAGNNGVYIQGSDTKSYIEFGTIAIGGADIGSLMINGISQKGSVTHIRGH